MGYLRHQALVVYSWDDEKLQAAHVEAKRIYGQPAEPNAGGTDVLVHLVSEVVPAAVNGGGSFLVAPDGSKEGWTTSDLSDERRGELIAWLDQQRYEDGSSALTWAELVIGGDDHEAYIQRHVGDRRPVR